MPVYKNEKAKGPNKWWFQFYTGEVVGNKRKRITRRGFKTKKEAEAAMILAQAAHNNGDYIEPSKLLYKDYLKGWLDSRRNISETTKDLYDSHISVHINPLLGHIPLGKITAHDIELFLDKLYKRGYANSTIKRIFAIVNASLNAAVNKDLIVKNVAMKVEKPASPAKKELKIWDPEYVSEFLDKTRDESRYWIAIYLAIMTGMRQGEILGLRWSDVDFEKRTLVIQQIVTKKRKIKSGAKTKGSVRSVAISPETVEVLKEHRKLILHERMKLGPDYQNNDLIVCTSFGGPATARSIQKMWTRIIQKYDVPKITFHDLRHTHASLLIKQGVHIKVISERLGHSTVAFTMDTYGHLLPNMQEQAADGLDNLIKTKKTAE